MSVCINCRGRGEVTIGKYLPGDGELRTCPWCQGKGQRDYMLASDERDQLILALRGYGLTFKVIAKVVGLSAAYVSTDYWDALHGRNKWGQPRRHLAQQWVQPLATIDWYC